MCLLALKIISYSDIGLLCGELFMSSFVCSGIALAMFILSVNIPVFLHWFMISFIAFLFQVKKVIFNVWYTVYKCSLYLNQIDLKILCVINLEFVLNCIQFVSGKCLSLLNHPTCNLHLDKFHIQLKRDAGPTLTQHGMNVFRLLGGMTSQLSLLDLAYRSFQSRHLSVH